ncbi:hypothetical protein LOAG_17683 [Loa loa]|uniref:SET domain-containing protein n=2 Tax=Loa loa TaxID=7209 RepID=A0A1S0UJX4_LOALO|nr:hypothetical protein LOAG_17683 [Loa loa]EJD75104.1 hypothetical protein LOAG_17683 [Loa loa]
MSDTSKGKEAHVEEHRYTEKEWKTDKDSSGYKQTTTQDSGMSQQALQTSAGSTSKNETGDGDGPLLKKVIIDDEGDSKESDNSTEDTVVGLTYQDHNYGRRSGNAQKNDGENGEKFPIIGGLASYIGDEISKVPAGYHSRDTNSGHFLRSHNYGMHYRKISEMDPRTSCRIYSGALGGCRTNQMRRLPVSSSGQIFSRQTPITATQNYRTPRRGSGGTHISANNQSDVLFRSRHFIGSGGAFGAPVPSNKRVLRPAHPLTPAVPTFRQSVRQVIPTSKSISATMPAYATAFNVTGTDSETHAADMSVGLAPFLVPSRRPRPVVRNRVRASREPGKGAELLLQKTVANDPQIDNTVHTEKQSEIITTSRQHLSKNVTGNSEVVKQQYIMAEPLEPCHVPRIQHAAQQRAVPNDSMSMIVDEQLSPKSLQNSSTVVHCKEEQETSPQSLSADSREPIYVNNDDRIRDPQQIAQTCIAFPHRSQQDITKYVDDHYRKLQKESFVANSRQLLTRQLDELQMRQPRIRHSETVAFDSSKKMKEGRVAQQSVTQSVTSVPGIGLHRQEPMSSEHVGLNQNRVFDSQQQKVMHSTSLATEIPMLPSKDRTASDNIPAASDVTLEKTDYKVSLVEDISSGEEPHVFNETCNEALEQRVSVATRSSISGAEEETSVNGNVDEKGTEDEGVRTTKIVTGLDSPSNSNSEDDWEEEYTTRCYCGLNHNDEFMIQCDVCNVWQHGKCMDIDRRRVPDTYQCEECNPRLLKLSKTQARAMQLKVLARQRKEKEKKRRQRAKGHFKKIREKSDSYDETKKKQIRGNSSKDYIECFKYEYTRSVMAFSRKHEDTGDPAVLEVLRNSDGVSVMYVTQMSMGLVSTRLYHVNEPVMYICGRVSLPCECRGREEPGSVVPFVTLYSDLVVEENREPTPICIDARRFGSKARFARTSCRPNIKVQHFFLKGKLHIIGIATGNIDRGEEITLPFDADYFMSKTKLVCACSADDEDDSNVDCLVRNFNRSLEQKQNLVSATASDTVSHSILNVGTTSKDHARKQYIDLEVEKVQANMKSKNISSGSRYSATTFSSKMTVSDYSGEVNTARTVETTMAVTPTAEDENATNKDVLPGSAVEMQSRTRATVSGSSRKARSKLPKISPSTASYRKKGGIKLRYRGAANYRTVETGQEACTNECENSVIPPKAKTEIINIVKDPVDVDSSLKKACLFSSETNVQAEEQHEEKQLVASNKECESVEENKFITEKLRTHTEAEIRTENVQKLDTIGAGSVVTKNVGRPKKKRRTPSNVRVVDAVDGAGKSEGNEHLATLDSSAKKMHSKNGMLEEVESVNYMLPEERNKAMSREERKVLLELALFERMQQREAKRQQHVACTRGTGSARSRLSQNGAKKAKNAKGRRRVSSSECPSKIALKRSRTMSEGAKWRVKSEAEQGLNSDLIKKAVSFSPYAQSLAIESKAESKMKGNRGDMTAEVEPRELKVFTDNTALSCKSSVLCAKRKIQNTAGSIQNNDTTVCPTDEEHIKDEIEPLSKRKRESNRMNDKSNLDMSEKASCSSNFGITEEIRAFFRKMVEIEAACEPSDFLLDFQTLDGVELPSTSLHAECSKNQVKVAEAPKKKMSLDEYKKRKSSKTNMDSEKTPAIVIEKKAEEGEHKQIPLSRSFIPLMGASGSVGKRASLRLGALPDPVQLRATPTLSIDDLKRRIYRRTTPSTAVTSNTDGISPSFMVQKNASHTSPGQCSEEGPTSFAFSSSSCRRELPLNMTFNKDKRLPLEERLRLVLGCGEGYADRYSSSVSPSVAPPPPPPPPPLPIKSSEIPKLTCDLSGDVHADIPLPPPPPTTTPSCSQSDQCSYEAHSLGPRRD